VDIVLNGECSCSISVIRSVREIFNLVAFHGYLLFNSVVSNWQELSDLDYQTFKPVFALGRQHGSACVDHRGTSISAAERNRHSAVGGEEAAAVFVERALAAKAGCPVSRALAGVPEITLEASLVQ